MTFELRTVNRSLQQKALNLGEESILDSTQTQPLSLHSEIQQSQVHAHKRTQRPVFVNLGLTGPQNTLFVLMLCKKTPSHKVMISQISHLLCTSPFAKQVKEALLAHSTVLQARNEEIQALKKEVC